MFDSLAAVISRLFEPLNPRGRWLATIGFILFIATILVILEQWTGYLYYTNLERKMALLRQLNELSQAEITTKPELAQLYRTMVEEVSSRKITPLDLNFLSQMTISEAVWKGISGAAFPLFVMLFTVGGSESKSSLILGSLIFAVIFGIAGFFLPTIINPWVNYIGLPVITFLILYGYSRIAKKS